ALPEIAQFSPINGFVHADLTGDKKPEILAAGNFYAFKPQLGRSDASFGVLMSYENGVKVSPSVQADLWLDGDIRDVEILQFKSGVRRLLVSRNNDAPGLYSVTADNTLNRIVRTEVESVP